jgi:WD40 repeat protein
MRTTFNIVLAGLLLALAACGAPVTGTTSAPNNPPSIASPNPTPAETPSRGAILLARLGKGQMHDAVYTPDGKFILVAFDTGIGAFSAAHLSEVAFWDAPEQALHLALLTGKDEVAVFTMPGNILFVGFDPASGKFSSSPRAALTTGVTVHVEVEDPTVLAGSPDGNFLAFSARQNSQVWNLETGQALLKDLPTTQIPYQISFSADNKSLLLSASFQDSSRGGAYLVDLASGKTRWKTSGKAILVYGGQILYWDSLDKYSLADLSDPKTARIFPLPIHTGPSELVFSPDGRLGACINWKFGVQLFQTYTGTFFNNFEGRPPQLEYTASPIYLSNGGLLFTYKSKLDNTVPGSGLKSTGNVYQPFILDLSKGVSQGAEMPPPYEISYPLPPVAFAPDGHTFLYFNRSSMVQVNGTTQASITFEDALTSGVTALAFSADGKTLAAGLQSFMVDLLDPAQGLMQTRSELMQLEPGGASRWYSGVTGLAFSPDRKQLVVITSNGTLDLLSLDSNRPLIELDQNSNSQGKGGTVEMFGLAVAPDGDRVATGGYASAVRLWTKLPYWNYGLSQMQGRGGVKLASLSAGGGQFFTQWDDSSEVTSLAWSPDGKWLAAGTARGFIRLWRADGTLERTFSGHTGRLTGLVFAGETLVSSAEDGSVRFWKAGDGAQTRLLNLAEPGTSLALDGRAELLALGTQSGTTYLWDMQNVRWLGRLPGVGTVRALAFQPDSSRLAIGLESGQVQLWQVRLADGQVAEFAAGQPGQFAAACKLNTVSKGSLVTDGRTHDISEVSFVAGGQARLEWITSYSGDCSKLDEKNIRLVHNTPDLAAHFSLRTDVNYTPGTQRLHINADVIIPATPGTYRYSWELISPTGEAFPFSASISVAAAPAALNLPAPLYFVSETQALLRLETDGHTLTPIIAAPVTCMDISPVNGEIAYLSQDALMLADLDGSNRRVLLPIGGCPSWSPDGTMIGFTLNGIKVLTVASGEIQSLATDLHSYGIQARYYLRVMDWSPDGSQFIASSGGWESYGWDVFDLPSSNATGLTGIANLAWSRDGKYVYAGEYEFNEYYGQPPYIIRNNISTGEAGTLLGNSETDLIGGFAPFESSDGRLLAFIGGISSPQARTGALAAARVSLTTPGQVTYDPTPHPIVSPSEALWWPDGSLAIVKLTGGEVLATWPFSKNPNVYLPVRGSDLSWNPFAPALPPALVPAATPAPAATSSTHPDLARYTLAFLGGAAGNPAQINTIHADGSNLMHPYPTYDLSAPLTQFAWSADGQSLFALGASEFYQVRKLDSQFYEYALPQGLPGYTVLNDGKVKDFSLSPNGRYLAVAYDPADENKFDLPNADQRLGRDNLGILDLIGKRWIDVNIPAISNSYTGKAATFFSALAWSKDSQQFVVTVTQDPGEIARTPFNGLALLSLHYGGGGSGTVGLLVVDIRGNAKNITLASGPYNDQASEYQPLWAQNDRIYFYSTDETGKPGLYRIAPNGMGQARIADCESMAIDTPAYAVSPDGHNLVARAISPEDGSSRWTILDAGTGKATYYLPAGASPSEIPVWSPDGKQLAWSGNNETQALKIFLINADGSHLMPLDLPAGLYDAIHMAWSPDGAWLAFNSHRQIDGIGLYVIHADGSGIQLVSSDLPEESSLQWSPVVLKVP